MRTIIVISALLLLFGTVGVLAKLPTNSLPYSELPRGLKIQVAEGRQIPVDWQKQLVVGNRLAREVYAHSHIVVPVDDRGNIIVLIENRRLRLVQRTLEVIEILN